MIWSPDFRANQIRIFNKRRERVRKFLVVVMVFWPLIFGNYLKSQDYDGFSLELGAGVIGNIRSLYPEEKTTPRLFLLVGPALQFNKFSVNFGLNQYASTGIPGNSLQALEFGCNYNPDGFYFGMSYGIIFKDHKQTDRGFYSYKLGVRLFTTDQVGAWLEAGLKRNTGYLAFKWRIGF